jgi:hypothetical protein
VRRGSRLLLAAAGLAAGGCTVGQGSGTANGTLMDVGCNGTDSLAMTQPYSLKPSFFAGEPIEDVCPSPPGQCGGIRMNRLTIRMQRSGNRVEVNDTLYFDVLDSYKVAQCVRGQTKNGVPQWDTRLVTGPDGKLIPGLVWCDWNWGANGGVDGGADGGAADAGAPDAGAAGLMTAPRARINLSTQDFVQSSLDPLYTCVEARSVGVALPGSWIEFTNFGNAGEANVPPEQRAGIPGDFKVDFGQRLSASFHLILGDQAVEYAIKTNDFIPDTRISGELTGNFDFDLDRGRAEQPFP